MSEQTYVLNYKDQVYHVYCLVCGHLGSFHVSVELPVEASQRRVEELKMTHVCWAAVKS